MLNPKTNNHKKNLHTKNNHNLNPNYNTTQNKNNRQNPSLANAIWLSNEKKFAIISKYTLKEWLLNLDFPMVNLKS
jgi:hypothetical protein